MVLPLNIWTFEHLSIWKHRVEKSQTYPTSIYLLTLLSSLKPPVVSTFKIVTKTTQVSKTTKEQSQKLICWLRFCFPFLDAQASQAPSNVRPSVRKSHFRISILCSRPIRSLNLVPGRQCMKVFKMPPPPPLLAVARVHSWSNQLKWKRIRSEKCKAPKPVNAPVLVKGSTDANGDCLQIFRFRSTGIIQWRGGLWRHNIFLLSLIQPKSKKEVLGFSSSVNKQIPPLRWQGNPLVLHPTTVNPVHPIQPVHPIHKIFQQTHV